jgi:hypothetical protein
VLLHEGVDVALAEYAHVVLWHVEGAVEVHHELVGDNNPLELHTVAFCIASVYEFLEFAQVARGSDDTIDETAEGWSLCAMYIQCVSIAAKHVGGEDTVHCMVPHSSDMQDPSQHMIPRHLQDTTFPLHHHHYSSIPLGTTSDSSSSFLKDAEGLITTYMHLPSITSSIHHCMVPRHSAP